MSKIIDYGRFAERLREPRPRWDLLREVQEEWGYTPPGEQRWHKGAETEHKAYMRRLKAEWLAEAEEEEKDGSGVDLSLPIPKALEEWWELPFNSFTHSPRLYWTNPEYPPTLRPDPSAGSGSTRGLPEDDPFVGPDGDRRLCVFKAEYQYCNEWAYLAAEAGQEDPRVLVSISDEEWVLQAASISEFFVQLAVVRLTPHFGWSLELDQDDFGGDAVFRERLAAAYRPMGFRPWRELETDTVIHGGPDVIVFFDRARMADWPVTITARTRDALEDAARTLGWDWNAEEVGPPATDEP